MNGKDRKILAEEKHKKVLKFLQREFPDCTTEYNHDYGIDFKIKSKTNTVWIECKTSVKFMGGGLKFTDEGDIIHRKRVGRFNFDNKQVYPYVKSQHLDLVDQKGWYVFMVDHIGEIRGCSAETVDEHLGHDWVTKRVPWYKILLLTYPDWVDRLKKEVYF